MRRTVEIDVDSYSKDTEECDKLYGDGTWQALNAVFLAMKKANMDKIFFTIDDKGARARIY